jgi:hypothetical protein
MRVSKQTQMRLKEVKGEMSYDELIGFLIKCNENHHENIEKIVMEYLLQYK